MVTDWGNNERKKQSIIPKARRELLGLNKIVDVVLTTGSCGQLLSKLVLPTHASGTSRNILLNEVKVTTSSSEKVVDTGIQAIRKAANYCASTGI